MAQATTTQTGSSRVSWGRVLLSGVVAALVGGVVAVIYSFIAAPLAGGQVVAPTPPDNEFAPLPWFAFFAAAAMPLFVSSIIYGLLLQFFKERGDTIFLSIAAVVLILSYGSFLTPGFPLSSVIVLGIAHLLVAVVGVFTLIRFYKRS